MLPKKNFHKWAEILSLCRDLLIIKSIFSSFLTFLIKQTTHLIDFYLSMVFKYDVNSSKFFLLTFCLLNLIHKKTLELK